MKSWATAILAASVISSLVASGTVRAMFRFILHDLDTDTVIIADDMELIIYGCGDGVCESSLENTSSCPGDCQ